MREAEEDNRLVFIERVKAAAFAVSDLMMKDLMAFIVSYPVKCLELMRDMESALSDESMDPPAFGGIMGMLRGQGPLFCVRRMYSGFGCALVAQMGVTLLEEAPFFVCRALGLFERNSALANSAFAVVYTGVVVAVPFKLVGEAAVVRRVFAACSSSPSLAFLSASCACLRKVALRRFFSPFASFFLLSAASCWAAAVMRCASARAAAVIRGASTCALAFAAGCMRSQTCRRRQRHSSSRNPCLNMSW